MCYSVVCDNCGIDSSEGMEHIGWSDKEAAIDIALDSDFLIEDDKQYCSNCYSYGDNDELIINLSRKNKFTHQYKNKKDEI